MIIQSALVRLTMWHCEVFTFELFNLLIREPTDMPVSLRLACFA